MTRYQAIPVKIVNGEMLIPKTSSKYRSVKAVTLSGQTFDSKWELDYYTRLLWLQKGGQIEDIQRQVHYPLSIGPIKLCTYVADFRVTVPGKGIAVIDPKGMETELFKLKAKLFRALYSFPLFVVKKGKPDPFMEWLSA